MTREGSVGIVTGRPTDTRTAPTATIRSATAVSAQGPPGKPALNAGKSMPGRAYTVRRPEGDIYRLQGSAYPAANLLQPVSQP